MNIPPIALRLKTDTAQAHEDLEKHPKLFAMGEGNMNLTGYADVLRHFYPFWVQVEQIAYDRADVRAALPDSDSRKLSQKIADDLRALNISTSVFTPPALSWVADLPSAMGTIYVIEGSSLGGRVIVKRVMDQLGLTPDHGCAFYSGYGAETGQKWKAFLESLGNCHFSDSDQDKVIDAANKTFDALNAWMDVDLNQRAA